MSIEGQRLIHKASAAFVVVVIAFSAWFASHSYGQGPIGAADDPMATAPEWLKNLGLTAGLGAGPVIAIWYLWYDVSRVKPRMERAQREQLKEMEDRHTAHWTVLNTNSRADLHELVKQQREDNARYLQAIDRLSDAIDKIGR